MVVHGLSDGVDIEGRIRRDRGQQRQQNNAGNSHRLTISQFALTRETSSPAYPPAVASALAFVQ